MADNLNSAQRRRTMQSVRSEGTSPEIAVRRILRSLGYSYRLHVRRLPGCPDFVLGPSKKIIFVHGCFWHGHRCRAGMNRPRSNQEYWQAKLERNRKRDRQNLRLLRLAGWSALVIWECQLKRRERVVERITEFLELRPEPVS